jgi:hypothetical protein
VFFPIWDIAFGTFYEPQRGEFPPMGIANVPATPTGRDVLLGPFIAWTLMVSHRLGSIRVRHATSPEE